MRETKDEKQKNIKTIKDYFPRLKNSDNNNDVDNTEQGSDGSKVPGREKDKDNFFLFNSGTRSQFSQYDVIRSIVSGFDTFCIIPTSGGKSMIYQAAAILLKRQITIVVSPLFSLISDQVDGFNKKMKERDASKEDTEPKYRAISFGMDNISMTEVFDRLTNPEEDGVSYNLLYISPEHLRQPGFQFQLFHYIRSKRLAVGQIAIDEAHCYSHWGLSFRNSYLAISEFIEGFEKLEKQKLIEKRPVISIFTATATEFDKQMLIRTIPLNMYHMKQFICLEKRLDLGIKCITAGDEVEDETAWRMEQTRQILKAYFNASKGNDGKTLRSALIYCTSINNIYSLLQVSLWHCRCFLVAVLGFPFDVP